MKAHEIYKRLERIIPLDKSWRFLKLQAPGYMDLNCDFLREVDYFGKKAFLIAMAHNSIQNGDVMADPDMELMVFSDEKRVIPVSFTNHYADVFHRSIVFEDGMYQVDHARVEELSDFLLLWVGNIKDQGHKIVETRAAE